MKNEWTTKRLAELGTMFVDGDWVESKDQSTEGIRLIQTGNVGDGVFKDRAEKARYISESTFGRLRCTEIFEGDCLISRLPDPVGRSCILPDIGERMVTAVDCTIVRFKPDEFLPSFFNLYSQSDEYLSTVAKECTGTTRSRISRSNLGKTPIPVPPLAEQQRIVRVLDEAFDGLATAQANAEKNLQNARALFESHLQSVFSQRGKGWVETIIGDCIRFIDYRGKTPKKTSSGLRLITAKNVKMGLLQREPEEFVAPETYGGWMTRGIPKKGDVLFTTEAPLANVAQLDTDEKVVFAQRIIIMQPNASRLDSTFLKYLLLSKPVQERIHTKGTGATVKGIKASLLETVEIFFPKTKQEQHAIASRLDALAAETQRLMRLYEQKQAALAALKKSLLHQAFTGEL
jgi:type I restriction enzyme, S subunit